MARNYYMVRAMDSSDESLEVFTKNGVVAIGWSEVDFTQFRDNSEGLRTTIEEIYYKDEATKPTNRALGRKYAAIRRFCDIRKGDYIIVPFRNQILLAEAEEEQRYSVHDKIYDLANQHVVSYLKNSQNELRRVFRSELKDGLQRRLRLPGSIVLDLSEFKDDINDLFKKKPQTVADKCREKIAEQTDAFKIQLMDRIANADTYLSSGGQGLEKLVAELLTCEGFSEVKILSKDTYGDTGADADIYAVKTDTFLGEHACLFQVKHHAGISNKDGIQQLIEAKKSDVIRADYFVFITTAVLDISAQELANEHDIICMQRDDFSDWLYENIDKLSLETRQKLGISTVPMLL